MMSAQSHQENRLHELLAARALEPLTEKESAELHHLQEMLGIDDDQTYDEIAALLDPVFDEKKLKPLPSTLQMKLSHDAIDWLTSSH